MTGQGSLALDNDDLLSLYYFMRLTRAIEDRTRAMYTEGKISGGVYTGAGMEATSVGAAYALAPGDVVAPLHRDLGAHLVRGTTPREVFCQWLGRGNSPTRGRDSRLHFGDMRQRMIIPATGVIGATLPVAAGTALAAKIRDEARVTLAFIGDGGTNTGDFHEALNLAASAWVPLVVIVENNGYAYSTPTSTHTRLTSLAQRAAAYGIPGSSVDGNDVAAVYGATYAAVERARGGGGPALIEARTFRMSGHSEADSAEYVPVDTLIEWAQRDPITQFEARLVAGGTLTDERKAAILARVAAEVEDAVRYAEASPPPDPESLAVHVFSDDGTGAIKPRRLPPPLADRRQRVGVPTIPIAPEAPGANETNGMGGGNGAHGTATMNGMYGANGANGASDAGNTGNTSDPSPREEVVGH
jgi:TPP-dependent pyruvate/acetoin dehydrogenase alpha subunit